ncbi:50S ribosomal protein L13 [Coccomyxa sp. Obi]|nr:50S ribosomal protein L13 [Coccomyxa sp. Obi]
MHSTAINSTCSVACSLQSRRLSVVPAPAHPRLTAAPSFRLDARRSGLSVSCSAAVTEESRQIASLGPDLWNRTYYPTKDDADSLKKPWYVVDAEGQTLGRLAVLVADHIRGKTVPTYSPSMDMGSYVVVVNAEKVTVSGNKFNDKMYRRHTGRPGSLKEETFKKLQARIPERIVEQAVKGMLPSGRIGRHLFTHLKVYKGPAHPHSAQQPVDVTHKINKKPQEAVIVPSA